MNSTYARLHAALVALVTAAVVGIAVVTPANAADGDFYVWAKWRLGHAPYTCQAGAAWVRPNVRPNIPPAWWERLKQYTPKPCPPAGEQPVDPPPAPIAEPGLNAREAALRDAVNSERRRHGLTPLPVGEAAERATRDHTADMVKFGYLGHDWHNGTSFGTWVSRYFTCTAGEIIAWRSPQETPAGAIQQWLHSPGHRAALLSSAWTTMGVELGQRHAVVIFAGRCRA
jgi:uncharacterized protein YkwD